MIKCNLWLILANDFHSHYILQKTKLLTLNMWINVDTDGQPCYNIRYNLWLIAPNQLYPYNTDNQCVLLLLNAHHQHS